MLKNLKLSLFFSFVAILFFGFFGLALAASTPECQTGCGVTDAVPYQEFCLDGSNHVNYFTQIAASCVPNSQANLYDGWCVPSTGSFCCTNGGYHIANRNSYYWSIEGLCTELGYKCLCEEFKRGDCSGVFGSECRLAYTTCTDSSQCCYGMTCDNGRCGNTGRCLVGSETCTCNAQCCSGTCTSGQCVACTANGGTCASNSDCCGNSCLLFVGVGYRCTPGSPPFPNGSFCTQNNQCSGGYCCNQACQSTVCPTENCSNNIDDDSDGLIDCQDSNCPSSCGICQLAVCSQTTYDWSCNPIVSCINNDGCCPAGCNSGNDSNCSAPSGCFTNGLACEWNSDCCSAYCRLEAPRVCADPLPVPSCSIQNISCPSACAIGETFNVSYDYRNTDYLIKPNISQRIVDWYYNNLWCLADQAVYDNSWHHVTRTASCPNTSMTIFVGGHSDPNHWTNWCSVSWNYAGIDDGTGCIASCQIEVIPPAIGFVKIKHPLGILSLRLISFLDALPFLRGILKIARFSGDTNASADLVELGDINASPVHVKTPYGIKAWRMAPKN